MRPDAENYPRIGWIIFYSLAGLVALILVIFGIAAIGKAYSRYQRRQDAENAVKVTKINAQQAQRQIQVIRAEARQRFQESIGLRRAQNEIRKTLTPLYIQHEAIRAQLAMAHSENHTIIWAPAGASGVPIVTDPLAQSQAEEGK
jgi:hypothetical protein